MQAQQERIRQLEIEIDLRDQEIQAIAQAKQTEGMEYEEVVKLSEFMRRENQKLQMQLLEVKDIDMAHGVSDHNPYKTQASLPDF